MFFTVTNYLNLFFRTSVVSYTNENNQIINLRNSWENVGNRFLYDLHGYIGERQVRLFKETYHENEVEHDLKMSLESTRSIAFIQTCLIILGISIKLFAWIFEQGAFARNKQLHQIQVKLLKELHEWEKNNKLCIKLEEKKPQKEDAAQPSLVDLPEEINLLIINFLNDKKDLYNISQVNARSYVIAHDDSIIHKRYPKYDLKITFGDVMELLPKQIDLYKSRRINLPVHKVSDSSDDLRIQKLGSAAICDGVDFLKPSDLGCHTVKWGISPVPFVAIQVKYTKQDDRFLLSLFTRLAFKLYLRKDTLIERTGVITITYQSTPGNNSVLIHNLRGQSPLLVNHLFPNGIPKPVNGWVVHYPWEAKSKEIIDYLDSTRALSAKAEFQNWISQTEQNGVKVELYNPAA